MISAFLEYLWPVPVEFFMGAALLLSFFIRNSGLNQAEMI
jgi:hypothetical protein